MFLRGLLCLCLTLITAAFPAYAAPNLSDAERSYLASREPVKVCIDPNWMPFEAITKQGEYTGVSADFMDAFARQLGVNLQLVPTSDWSQSMTLARAGQCDLLPMINRSEERETFLSFTSPYIRLPVVLLSHQKSSYLDGLKSLSGQTLAVPEGYIFVEYVKQNFPDIQLQTTSSLRDALLLVAKGEATAAMASLPIALYQIEQHGLSNLKIGGHTDFRLELGIGIRKDDPLLASSFQKAVEAMTERMHDDILDRWYEVKVEQARDYRILLVLIGLLTLMAGFLSYRNYSSRRFNAELSKVNARLHDRNQRLEQLAKRDYLTGIYHRMNMDTELEKDIDHCCDHGQPLSLILFDLDNFSDINVRHGHPVADLLLVEVSRLMEERLPDGAYFGRWGGDSFLVLCPQAKRDEVENLAKRLSCALEAHRFSENIQLSATFVVAGCHSNQQHAGMMKDAEQLMRDTKTRGTGQVVLLDCCPSEEQT